MPTKIIFTLVAALSIVAAGCSSDDGAATTTSLSAPTTVARTTAPTTTPTATAQPTGLPPTSYSEFRQQAATCGADTPTEAAEMTFAEAGNADVAGQITITLNTSCGPITIVVDSDAAEKTVNSFIFLAEQGYFDGTVSHRVLPGFMMQAGDPTATGRGGPGYSIPDELPPGGFVYERGVVAMANAGPNTGGSQFFIMFGTADWLPSSYSVFGRVVDGYDALDAIEEVPLGMSASGGDGAPSTPLETVYIESVTVER
jgi:cyclophilin family peptidyl-prolyl cis-trans isomerase